MSSPGRLEFILGHFAAVSSLTTAAVIATPVSLEVSLAAAAAGAAAVSTRAHASIIRIVVPHTTLHLKTFHLNVQME